MRLPRGPEFNDEWRKLDFRFCCEDCTYLDRERDCCVHGWPAAEHHIAHYEDPECKVLVFCKEFELL